MGGIAAENLIRSVRLSLIVGNCGKVFDHRMREAVPEIREAECV